MKLSAILALLATTISAEATPTLEANSLLEESVDLKWGPINKDDELAAESSQLDHAQSVIQELVHDI